MVRFSQSDRQNYHSRVSEVERGRSVVIQRDRYVTIASVDQTNVSTMPSRNVGDQTSVPGLASAPVKNVPLKVPHPPSLHQREKKPWLRHSPAHNLNELPPNRMTALISLNHHSLLNAPSYHRLFNRQLCPIATLLYAPSFSMYCAPFLCATPCFSSQINSVWHLHQPSNTTRRSRGIVCWTGTPILESNRMI